MGKTLNTSRKTEMAAMSTVFRSKGKRLACSDAGPSGAGTGHILSGGGMRREGIPGRALAGMLPERGMVRSASG